MKPLNEKERTSAFVQFITLFFVVIVLVVVLVFFDYGVKSKQYQALKTENQSLNDEKVYLKGLSYQIDSMVVLLKTLDKASPIDLENSRSIIRTDLRDWSTKVSADSTTLERIRVSLSKAFLDWLGDKTYVNAQINDKGKCDEIVKQKEALQGKFDELEKEFNDYKMTH